MKSSRRMMASVLLLAAVIPWGQLPAQMEPDSPIAVEVSPDENPGENDQEDDPPQIAMADLLLSLRVAHPECTESLRLHITIQNFSDNDYLLNLGTMKANGRLQIPGFIHLVLTKPDGQATELHFREEDFPGPVRDYVVPIRTRGTFGLEFRMRDWCIPESGDTRLDLTPGRYKIRAVLSSKAAQHADANPDAPEAMEIWTGKLNSNVVRFQLPDEPMHEGRTVSSWLQDFAYGRFPDMDKHRAAGRALRAIGQEAIPVLVRRLSIEADTLDSIQDIHTMSAFEALGATARPAIPSLIQLLAPAYDAARDSDRQAQLQGQKSIHTAYALQAIGDDSVGPLIAALASEDKKIRFGAAEALERPYPGSQKQIVEALIKAARDEVRDVRWRAVRSLGWLKSIPELSVPAIAERLQNDPDSTIRFYAVIALRNFGKPGLPDLIKASTKDPDQYIRNDAAKAVEQIESAPE